MTNRLRVGYIVDESGLPFTVWDLVQKSYDNELYEISVLIVQKNSAIFGQSIFRRAKKYGLWFFLQRACFKFLYKFEQLLVSRHPKYSKIFRSTKLEFTDIKKIFVEPSVSPSGFVYRYSSGDIQKIKDLNLDLLIRGGSGILRGEILSACRLGVISFHHGNNQCNRGGPPGFWEVFNREPSTGFIIQKLTEELDGGEVIFKGQIATSHFYVLNAVRLYQKANVFMHLMLENIARNRSLPSGFPQVPYCFQLYRVPNLDVQLVYFVKTFFYFAIKKLQKALGRSARWSVAYQFVHDWRAAVLWKTKPIKNPKNGYFADPFVCVRDGRSVLFVEEFLYPIGRGRIAAIEVSKTGYKYLGPVLEEPFHLSFPFVFLVNGELFMCPETLGSGDIRLYKCQEFPNKWTLHKILKKNINAVDTTIFPKEGKWWMLTTIDTSEVGDHTSELHLFYADQFDSDCWTPVKTNPVVFNSGSARNGGLILQEDDVFRVFQSQGFDAYGQAMGVARIAKVCEDVYQEENVCQIVPKFFKNLYGVHSLSFQNGVLAIDYVKIERRIG